MPPEPHLSNGQCHDFMERAHACTSRDALYTLCREISSALYCSHFMLSAVVPTSLYNPQVVTIDGYPEGFSEHYRRHACWNRDPIARRTMAGATRPLIWHELDLSLEPDPTGSVEYSRERERFGLRSGVSFPGRNPEGVHTVWSIASVYPARLGSTQIRHILPQARLIATALQEPMTRIALQTCRAIPRGSPLTPRERDCLSWSAAGLTSSAIAAELGVGENTVVGYLRKATSKLEANNRAQAVARAMTLGLIHPAVPGS